MAFKPLVRAINQSLRDPSNSVTFALIQTLKKEIQNDVLDAYTSAHPLIQKFSTVYEESQSFLDFLFQLCQIPVHGAHQANACQEEDAGGKNCHPSCDLKQCQDQLITASRELEKCKGQLEGCRKELEKCQKELGGCQLENKQWNIDFRKCRDTSDEYLRDLNNSRREIEMLKMQNSRLECVHKTQVGMLQLQNQQRLMSSELQNQQQSIAQYRPSEKGEGASHAMSLLPPSDTSVELKTQLHEWMERQRVEIRDNHDYLMRKMNEWFHTLGQQQYPQPLSSQYPSSLQNPTGLFGPPQDHMLLCQPHPPSILPSGSNDTPMCNQEQTPFLQDSTNETLKKNLVSSLKLPLSESSSRLALPVVSSDRLNDSMAPPSNSASLENRAIIPAYPTISTTPTTASIEQRIRDFELNIQEFFHRETVQTVRFEMVFGQYQQISADIFINSITNSRARTNATGGDSGGDDGVVREILTKTETVARTLWNAIFNFVTRAVQEVSDNLDMLNVIKEYAFAKYGHLKCDANWGYAWIEMLNGVFGGEWEMEVDENIPDDTSRENTEGIEHYQRLFLTFVEKCKHFFLTFYNREPFAGFVDGLEMSADLEAKLYVQTFFNKMFFRKNSIESQLKTISDALKIDILHVDDFSNPILNAISCRLPVQSIESSRGPSVSIPALTCTVEDTNKVDALENVISNLKGDNDTLRETLDHTETQLREVREKLRAANTTNQKLQTLETSELQKLRRDLKGANAKHGKLETERNDAVDNCGISQRRLAETKLEVTRLETEMEDVKKRNNTLQEANETLEKSTETLKEDNIRLHLLVDEWKKECQKFDWYTDSTKKSNYPKI